ncbi:hypothetical protein [Rhizobium halophilum]|uniref:hypothetical protein n=1 Tax=Rhizobium halophilum TaxID=2846852 RepID=UPI001EFEA53E|nr:hypothetical protein [Rhizobium halophilum]MCF6370968.1 hypothetical protein [Rhizobium halophilum]
MQIETTEVYLPTATYDRLIAALMTAPRECAWTGAPDADQIKIALGEVADIWPASIAPQAN